MATIYVIAGCNGAGKSSIVGAALRDAGADYFNPDEAARAILSAQATPVSQEEANGAAWAEGKRLLERAIRERRDFAFETTLGGHTITELLLEACNVGIAVNVWFVGLATPEMHIERVRQRVAQGGHDIPVAKIRERFDRGRENLVRILPHVASLRLFDNSAAADPALGLAPHPHLVIEVVARRVVTPKHLSALAGQVPEWAKPIAAAALRLHLQGVT